MPDRLNLISESNIKQHLNFNDKKLPSFPQVAAKLIKLSNDKSTSLPDISKIVETDPGISVRVLEIVNSAVYGLRKDIRSLAEAVVFLGMDEIKKLALGITVFEKMFKSGQNKEFNRLLFWRHCISVAVLSMEIAKEIGYSDPEEAYTAGLIHDIGKIFLDIKGRKNYGDFIRELPLSTDLVIEKERDFTGIGHDDVGAFFCSLWKLPEKLVLAVRYHHQPFEHFNLANEEMELISIVALADLLCWTQGIGSFDLIRPPILAPEVEKTINLEKIDIIKCLTQMNMKVENISEFYHFIFPSINQIRENLLWANLKLSKANTRYYYQKDPLAEARKTTTIEDNKALFPDMALELGKPLAKAKTIKEILDIVMYQVGRIFQPQHWSILLKDPKTSNMVFSVVVGTNKKKLQGVKLPKGEGIAGHIMETGESLIIKDVSKDDRFSIRVDKYTGFKTNSIIGTPLKTDNKIFGVIELINKISDDNFTAKDLKVLSSIAEYAAIAIERSYYNQALTNLATKDSLTGLKNRWSFERAISNRNEVLRHYGTIFSMLIVEIDKFQQIIDTQGRAFADEILKELTGALNNIKSEGYDIFRYGEESFILLLPHIYTDEAKKIKNKIIDSFSMMAYQKNLAPTKINISPHTVNASDYGQLQDIVERFLSKSKGLVNEESIDDFEDSLQSMLENENKQEVTEESIEKQTFGKEVSLNGSFIRLKTKELGKIRVEKLSMLNIGFRVSKSHRLIKNDFLDVQFTLDDIKKSLVKRRVVIRDIKGNYIEADFYNPPPYAKNLGFYLMS